MGFLSEEFSAADREKFGLAQIDKRFVGGKKSRQWTIDKERNIYLRVLRAGREEFCNQSEWSFYWHGELLIVKVEQVGAGGSRGGPGWTTRRIMQLDLPEKLEGSRQKIIADLRDAFAAYKDGGVYSTTTEFKSTLEFE